MSRESAQPFAAGTLLPPVATLPDIARKLRRLSAEIGADEFAICFSVLRGSTPRLLPVLDAAYPGISERTRQLPELPEAVLRHVATHTAPFRWAADHFARDEAPFVPFEVEFPFAGTGFPVFTEQGQRGVVLFTGEHPQAAGDLVWEAHCRCLQFFAVVAGLRPAAPVRGPRISKREMECLKLTARGLTSEDIARQLGLSVHTANQYLASTTQKLDATNRIHAVAKAMRLGLID
jgi:DNA-binding CsgD family transcriptional regulator